MRSDQFLEPSDQSLESTNRSKLRRALRIKVRRKQARTLGVGLVGMELQHREQNVGVGDVDHDSGGGELGDSLGETASGIRG